MADRRQEQLYQIRRALEMHARSDPGPRTQEIWGWSVAVGVLTLFSQVIAAAAAKVEVSALLFVGVPVGLGLVAGVWRYQVSDAPATHGERIDRLLASYDPVDAAGYKAMQLRVREQGHLERAALESWVAAEEAALRAASDKMVLSTFSKRQLRAGSVGLEN